MELSKLQELLKSMSLEEKLGELQQLSGHLFTKNSIITGNISKEKLTQEDLTLCGSVINVYNPEEVIRIQKEHIENHSHHIPLLFMGDIIHGYCTIFPIPLAQGASFDPNIVYDICKNTAKEACASGVHVTFSPMVDLVRDARWGRVMESSGEDPYLNSVMADAAVRGYQGENISKENCISACVKHYAAYGLVEGGREYNSTDISERSLRQYFLPPYKAACDAGSGMLMTAFTSIGGVPASGSKKLLNDILREEWEYDGAVITDYGSIATMKSHAISDDNTVLAKLGVEGNIDIEMCSSCYKNGIPKLLEDGKITEAQVDKLVMRVLKLKNKLGLFENPYHFTDPQKSQKICESAEILSEARRIIPKTSVLLKNEDNILPLNVKNKKYAFIGPYVDTDRMLGCWVVGDIQRKGAKTVKQAIAERYPEADITVCKGCNFIGIEDSYMAEFFNRSYEIDEDKRESMIESAVQAAKNADTVVAFLGEYPSAGGELSSRTDITIHEIQKELFRKVCEVNKNVVVVLFNHRPLEIKEISQKAKAILDVWFPGTMGADAILDMLFGVAAPSGRLSMTFPQKSGQVPIYYNHLPTDHSPEFGGHYTTGYIDCPLEPLYSFGEGLTYTKFEYSEIKLDKTEIGFNEKVTASVTVKNIGNRNGEEVVQLYIRDRYASVSRPVKELKGFKKIELSVGEQKNVEFVIDVDMLKFYNTDLEYLAEAGEFQVFIGPNSKVKDYKSFYLK